MSLIELNELRELISDENNFFITKHIMKRFQERGISVSDIINVIKNGEIIEQYPDDFPHPSCLMLGNNASGDPLHICCGVADGKIWFITAYFPSKDKWENDLKTRKKAEQ